ncbi:MAG: phosphatidylserine decarboxylase, partial [Acidobacteriota bacterium]|nr:phosphatidylserine decarboxylase [Acidobacteriota bacterium]
MKYESFKRKKIIMIGILLCVLFTAGTLIMAENQYSPVVNELKELYEKNPQFAQLLDDALKSAVVPPGGWAPDPKDPSKLFVWREKNFNDLLDFFEGWLYFVPNPSNGMSYYELFYGLCYQNECALNFVEMEPGLSWTREFVEARGEYMDKKDSIDNNKPTMDLWFKTMGDKWYDFQPLHPINEGYKGYTTFNEFFTRDIKPGKRPIAFENDETILVAPADGLTNVVNSNLSTDSLIHTKYTEYLNVEQLLDRSEYAKFFLGGTAVSTVLLPPDYHHYHSPVDGYMVESKEVDVNTGIYFGMDGGFYTYSNNGNIGGYQAKYGIFGQYHRGYYIIKTENFGYIAM